VITKFNGVTAHDFYLVKFGRRQRLDGWRKHFHVVNFHKPYKIVDVCHCICLIAVVLILLRDEKVMILFMKVSSKLEW